MRVWSGARRSLALAILAGSIGVWVSAAANAQEPAAPAAALDAVLERLNRLESENQKLRQELNEHKQQLQQMLPAVKDEAGRNEEAAPHEADVRRMIGVYLEERDDRRKKAEEQQKKAAAEQGYEIGTDVSMKASWKDGFNAATPNGDFRIHLGGRLQTDAGWFSPDTNVKNAFPDRWQDGADIRRFRFRTDGTAYEIMDWVLEMEFSQGINGLTTHPFPTNAFVDFKALPFLGNVTVGHFKEPFSLEDYGTPDTAGIFMERSGADSAFTPDRNLGVMWHEAYAEDKLAVAAGVFRSNSDARSGNVFDYGDGEYAYTARLAYMPLYEANGRCWSLFGLAYSHRCLDPDDPGIPAVVPGGGSQLTNASRGRFAARVPLRINTPTIIDASNLVADSVDLYNVQAALSLGPLLLQGEYYFTQVINARRGALAADVPRLTNPSFDGFYVQASYFLTNEYHPLDRTLGRLARVRPIEDFFFVRRGGKGSHGYAVGRGAWEIAARYGYVGLSSPVLAAFPAVPGVPNSAAAPITTAGVEHDVTLSLSVYMNPNTRLQMNYARAFRGVNIPAGRGFVDMLGVRLWWDF